MIVSDKVFKYIEQITSDPSPNMMAIERETHLKTMAPQMISGKIQGRFLSMISHMIKPIQVLEIGTFTGYGAISLAEGLATGGKVHTVEANLELEKIIRANISQLGYDHKIIVHMDLAERVIPQLEIQWDLVFIDAGKKDYGLFYDMVFNQVKKGGFILADNVLWDGKVVRDSPDTDTQTILTFNKRVSSDTRVENLILPLVDGMMLCRKK